jgi:hypothetical protein
MLSPQGGLPKMGNTKFPTRVSIGVHSTDPFKGAPTMVSCQGGPLKGFPVRVSRQGLPLRDVLSCGSPHVGPTKRVLKGVP